MSTPVQDLVSIDGRYFNIFIPEDGIKRTFAVADTDQAGRVQTGEMVRDIIGTFYNYTVDFNTNFLSEVEYDELWDTLSDPVEYHIIKVPYGQETLQFKAYVANGSDTLKYIRNGKSRWRNLSINFIANKPQRYPR